MTDIKVVEEKNTVKVNPRDTNVIAVQEVRNYVEVSASGPQGATGPQGPQGEPGVSGIPVGGTQGQVLAKSSNTDYATTWSNTVSSVIGGTGLTGGTITTTGTLAVDSAVIPYLTASQTFTGTQTLTVSNASATPLVLQGITSQTGNLLTVKNVANNVITKIDSNGNLLANSLGTINSFVVLQEENSGGVGKLTKVSSVPTVAGSDNLKIYVRDGSTAGTLRLSIQAGASGDEVTIVDKISQTGGLSTSTLGVSIIEGGNA
jgi:hypothetical protein